MEEEEEVQLDGVIETLIASREKVFSDVELSITKAQRKQKDTYDRKHQPASINVGAEVLLENTAQKQRKGGKLEPVWLGPYIVSRCVGKGLYELSRNGKVMKKKANIGRLKVYRKRTLKEMQLNVRSEEEMEESQMVEERKRSGIPVEEKRERSGSGGSSRVRRHSYEPPF